jgi:hypothetical protein
VDHPPEAKKIHFNTKVIPVPSAGGHFSTKLATFILTLSALQQMVEVP